MLITFGFLLNHIWLSVSDTVYDCPIKSPCSCSYIVDCNNRNLSQLPPLLKASLPFNHFSFKYNSITRVDDGYFSNLTLFFQSAVIDLSYNAISYISPRAFQGLEDIRLDLRLEHNDIRTLPSAFMHLNNLVRLKMSGIRTFDAATMGHIGKTLETLTVGDLTFWPYEFKLLRKILYLTVYELRISKLSDDDVRNFIPSLTHFFIEDSSFQEPLEGLCTLQNLQVLMLLNITAPPGVTAFPNCPTPLRQINLFEVETAYLGNISSMLESMPGVFVVRLTGEGLTSLTLPPNNSIHRLTLNSTALETFPKGKAEHLSELSIGNSKLTAITRGDLESFPKLNHLLLQNNPLMSISDDALDDNPNLESIDLSNSNLTSVPKAITRLPFLRYLSLKNNPISCSCDMAWLLGWSRFQKVFISGTCLGYELSIAFYTRINLTSCVDIPVVG